MYSTVFVAGYGNSEPKHWQRLWYKRFKNSYWVEQEDWSNPNKDIWIKEFETTLVQIKGPVYIVCHSIGCHTLVEWIEKYYKNQNIIGAILVAPPDTKCKGFPKEIKGYENPPLKSLPFKSVCVISNDDPYSSKTNATYLATQWGSEIVHVENCGHINLSSNLGYWEEGIKILESII